MAILKGLGKNSREFSYLGKSNESMIFIKLFQGHALIKSLEKSSLPAEFGTSNLEDLRKSKKIKHYREIKNQVISGIKNSSDHQALQLGDHKISIEIS